MDIRRLEKKDIKEGNKDMKARANDEISTVYEHTFRACGSFYDSMNANLYSRPRIIERDILQRSCLFDRGKPPKGRHCRIYGWRIQAFCHQWIQKCFSVQLD